MLARSQSIYNKPQRIAYSVCMGLHTLDVYCVKIYYQLCGIQRYCCIWFEFILLSAQCFIRIKHSLILCNCSPLRLFDFSRFIHFIHIGTLHVHKTLLFRHTDGIVYCIFVSFSLCREHSKWNFSSFRSLLTLMVLRIEVHETFDTNTTMCKCEKMVRSSNE